MDYIVNDDTKFGTVVASSSSSRNDCITAVQDRWAVLTSACLAQDTHPSPSEV